MTIIMVLLGIELILVAEIELILKWFSAWQRKNL